MRNSPPPPWTAAARRATSAPSNQGSLRGRPQRWPTRVFPATQRRPVVNPTSDATVAIVNDGHDERRATWHLDMRQGADEGAWCGAGCFLRVSRLPGPATQVRLQVPGLRSDCGLRLNLDPQLPGPTPQASKGPEARRCRNHQARGSRRRRRHAVAHPSPARDRIQAPRTRRWCAILGGRQRSAATYSLWTTDTRLRRRLPDGTHGPGRRLSAGSRLPSAMSPWVQVRRQSWAVGPWPGSSTRPASAGSRAAVKVLRVVAIGEPGQRCPQSDRLAGPSSQEHEDGLGEVLAQPDELVGADEGPAHPASPQGRVFGSQLS